MIMRHLWSFGDGRWSTEANPVHIYRMAGQYTVIHTVWDETGASSTLVETNFITVSEADVTINGYPVRRTNFCLRYANKPTQGVGWSRYTGYFPFPETRVGTLKLLDTNNNARLLAPDSRTGKFYEIGTRNGPDGSGLVKVFQDLVTSYQAYDIACMFMLKEHRGTYEHYKIQHQEGHFYFRPYEETDRNTVGHNAAGYLTGLEVDISAFVDGELNHTAKTKDIPLTGDIVYQRKVEGHRIATKIQTNKSSWKMVETNQYYNMKDSRGSLLEITMSEHSWEDQLANDMLLFLSRSGTPEINRIPHGVNPYVNTYFALTTGPDGKTDSAFIFSNADGLADTLPENPSGDASILFWIRNPDNDVDIYESTSLVTGIGFRISLLNGVFEIWSTADGSMFYTPAWDQSEWAAFKVTRKGLTWTFSMNGVLLQTWPILGAVEPLGDTYVIMSNMPNVGEIGCDFRVFDKAISEDAFLFYYEDITQNSGDGVCPLW